MEMIGPQLKILDIQLEKALTKQLKMLGINLTGTQLTVLTMIYNHSDVIVQKEIETTLKLSHPTTRGIVKRLVANSLVETSPLPDDHRQIGLYLTTQGKRLLAENLPVIRDRVAQVEQKLLQNLSEDEIKNFKKALAVMVNNMN